MKPRLLIGAEWSSGRVMQWFSSRPCGTSLPARNVHVRRQLADPDVLGQPDGADGVEPGVPHVAVVAVAEVDVEAAVGHRLLAPLGLLLRQRDRDDADAVVLRGVHRHAAPAAADVEQPHAGLERELLADQVELVVLRLLERRRRVRTGSTRRCRPSRAPAPTRRRCCSRRSGARSPSRRAAWCGCAARTGSAWHRPPAAAASTQCIASRPSVRSTCSRSPAVRLPILVRIIVRSRA